MKSSSKQWSEMKHAISGRRTSRGRGLDLTKAPLLMRRLGQLASLALVLLSGVPAMAQQYYAATVGLGSLNVHYTQSGSDCNGPFSSVMDNTFLGGASTSPGTFLPLLMKTGQWIPASFSLTSAVQIGTSFKYTAALAAGGIVTTLNSSSYNDGVGTSDTSLTTETIDLNTGNYTMHLSANQQGAAGACPYVEVETQDRKAYLPITLSKTTAPNASISIVDPLATYVSSLQVPAGPASIATNEVPASHTAISLAADGAAAVVVVYRSNSNAPVTFVLTAPAALGPFGSLSQFDQNYDLSPNPGTVQNVTVSAPPSPDSDGNYTFLALLWAPSQMPVPPSVTAFPSVNLTVTATQPPLVAQSASILLLPPPLLLVHGIWSSADQAWPLEEGFRPWIGLSYPHQLIYPVDYGSISYKAFNDVDIQKILLRRINDSLVMAIRAGMAVRRVDVVAHSMGGLVARYFLSQNPSTTNTYLPANPFHKLITIGTPHFGSPLLASLENNLPTIAGPFTTVGLLCKYFWSISPCTVQSVFKSLHRQVDTGAQSMVPFNSDLLSISTVPSSYSSVVGVQPAVSPTDAMFNLLIGSFLPGETDESILGYPNDTNDTLVSATSQSAGAEATATVQGVVHTTLALGPVDTSLVEYGETTSPAVWNQLLWWLTGGSKTAPASTSNPEAFRRGAERQALAASTSPPLVLDLTGYTQVAASNASFSPATNSNLTINSSTNITVTSPAKTLTELLLFQTVTDPTDALLLYAIQSPFSIAFTPTRLGSADFVAFALFSDMTYATTTLHYTLQTVGAPVGLNLIDAPAASLPLGTSTIVHAKAQLSNGLVDVTQTATYNTRAASSPVFSVSPGGTITAIGTGIDILDVSYSGVSASAPIAVGACTYTLAPLNQIVPFSGGSVNVQVTTTPGCGWTADGGDPWLTLANASGSGSGTITLTVTANSSGATQVAFVTLAGHNVAITQPATACRYSVSTAAISVAASGASGTIGVTTSCPVVASSNVSWIVPVALSSSVDYTVAGNTSTALRTASLTVGTQSISVTQGGLAPYLVGDVFPSTGDTVGNFGDGSINTLDLLAVLRAITNIPGALPAACSDLFDAMDVFPLDTANQRGGDGVLNTLDLLALLRRVTNIDTSRPTRTSLGLSCSSASAQAVRSPDQYAGALFVGALVNGQRPVYLLADQALSLAGFSLGLGVGNTRIQFVSAPGLSPSLVDTEVPGVLAAAWLNGLSLPAGERVLLGYIGAPEGSVKLFGASGNTADSGRTVHFRLQGRQTQ